MDKTKHCYSGWFQRVTWTIKMSSMQDWCKNRHLVPNVLSILRLCAEFTRTKATRFCNFKLRPQTSSRKREEHTDDYNNKRNHETVQKQKCQTLLSLRPLHKRWFVSTNQARISVSWIYTVRHRTFGRGKSFAPTKTVTNDQKAEVWVCRLYFSETKPHFVMNNWTFQQYSPNACMIPIYSPTSLETAHYQSDHVRP